MSRKQAFLKFQSELHISYSQIFTYLACSLKYKFQYVEQRLHERVSIALAFGSAIHSAIERYYRSLRDNGVPDPLWQIQDLFAEWPLCIAPHNGHYVTFAHSLGNDIIIYNGREFKIICSQCGY
jgi:PD-(D/E)XK nuclease superfamily protein